MNPSFSMSWAQHRGMSEPLQIEEALTQSQRVVQALNDSMRHPPKQEPMAEVVQLFEDLRKAVPPKLPADAARYHADHPSRILSFHTCFGRGAEGEMYVVVTWRVVLSERCYVSKRQRWKRRILKQEMKTPARCTREECLRRLIK